MCIHYTEIREKSKAPVRSETHSKIRKCDGALSTKITVQLNMALPWFQLTVYVLQLSVYKAREQGTGNRNSGCRPF